MFYTHIYIGLLIPFIISLTVKITHKMVTCIASMVVSDVRFLLGFHSSLQKLKSSLCHSVHLLTEKINRSCSCMLVYRVEISLHMTVNINIAVRLH